MSNQNFTSKEVTEAKKIYSRAVAQLGVMLGAT
jgi:hypothetical protein